MTPLSENQQAAGSTIVQVFGQSAQEAQQQAKAMSPQQTILFFCTGFAIIASTLFWYEYWSANFNAPNMLVQGLLLLFGLLCALVFPLQLSTLIPSTPLGYMLLKSRWHTTGYAFVGVSIVIFGFFTWDVVQGFLGAYLIMPDPATDPMTAELADQLHWRNIWISAVLLILIVGVPAWSWVQAMPEKALLQLLQDHQVKKMELQFQMEVEQLESKRDQMRVHHKKQIAVLKATYHQALQRLRLRIEDATIERFAEVAGILQGLHGHERDVINSMRVTVEELQGTKDLIPQIHGDFAVDYDDLAQTLRDSAARQLPAVNAPAVEVRPAVMSPQQLQQDLLGQRSAGPAPPRVLPATPQQGEFVERWARNGPDQELDYQPPPGSEAAQGGPVQKLAPRTLGAMRAVRQAHPQAFTRQQVMGVLNKGASTASELIKAWKEAGYCRELETPAHTYSWT